MKYECVECGIDGVKLWREYQTFTVRLKCVTCATEGTDIDPATVSDDGTRPSKHRVTTDQLGWWVPAVRDADGNFWGYTSSTEEDYAKWVALPLDRELTEAEIEKEMTSCPYYRRYFNLGDDGDGICQSGCYDEPVCVTSGPWSTNG